MTTLGRWYAEVLDALCHFSRFIQPVIERGELSPDATPPCWVLSACDPVSSPSKTPHSSVVELRQRLSDAESIRFVAVTLTPSLIEILSWDQTDVLLPNDLQEYFRDELDESNVDWTAVSDVELDVNLLVAEMGDGRLTAFTFVTKDGSHTVLLTDDEDASCWANGWIDSRLAES